MTAAKTADSAAGPTVPLTQTPEFQAALDEGVKVRMDAMRDEFAKMLADARKGAPQQSGDAHFAEKIAMAMAQLTDQGTGRKRVAPEVIEQRARSRDNMIKLIIAARAAGTVPTYQLRNKVYLDEVLIDPVWIDREHQQRPVEIDWPGVPSEAMIPTNDAAKGIHAAFIESIGSVAVGVPGDVQLAGVTAGGLTVRAGGRSVQPISPVGGVQAPEVSQGLRMHHKQDRPGTFKETRILGTVAPPARQTA